MYRRTDAFKIANPLGSPGLPVRAGHPTEPRAERHPHLGS